MNLQLLLQGMRQTTMVPISYGRIELEGLANRDGSKFDNSIVIQRVLIDATES